MNKYECPKCKRVVVLNSKADKASLVCCEGKEKVLEFKKLGTAIVVPVTQKLEGQKPLPPSTPAK